MSINIMHNGPAVYVPTQPEGNGLTLPTLLSLLAHSLVIGLLVYNYQNTEVDMTDSIETVMVSPEQLADMQGQILANRAAAQAASANSSATAVTQENEFDSNDASQNSAQSSSQQVPTYSRPDNTAGRPLLMSAEHHQRLLEQNREYEQRMAEWAEELDESVAEKHDVIERDKRDEQIEDQQRLQEYRNKPNNAPKIIRPNNKSTNVEFESNDSDSAPQNYSLAKGESISGDTATSNAKESSRSAASGSRGASNSEIINLIKRNYNPPTGAKGATQRATLTITVNASGKVTNVSVSGPDSKVNEAAKQAAWDADSFPIDTSDPKYPTFDIQFKGSN
jgi:TonB family protein